MSSVDTTSISQSSRASSIQSETRHARSQDGSRLRPEDAVYGAHRSRRIHQRKSSPLGRSDTVTAANANSNTSHAASNDSRKRREKRRGRSGSRRRKVTWKKLLWVKQSYPDNYTDEETFLDHLQRNPRLRPYEFWPLVADSTIIVQHVCSVIIFVCCFTAIFQERVSPQTVVGWATGGTVAGWVVRDWWKSREEAEMATLVTANQQEGTTANLTDENSMSPDGFAIADFGMPFSEPSVPMSGSRSGSIPRIHSRNTSGISIGGSISPVQGVEDSDLSGLPPIVASPSSQYITPYQGKPSALSPRMQERLMTAKSALLIYCSLLGLSPILKSLTKSTSSDSIWALSSSLIILNVFTFDYGAGPEAKFPASLSTNAALMASTVLASRLPSTTHVFSLTLFSIEVFGLFPAFRRHLRHHSWNGHLWLTFFLVITAGAGLSMTISGGGWGFGIVGAVLGGLATCLAMGMTSWWLIGLQRYKNEIRGPWDPARPVIRRGWD